MLSPDESVSSHVQHVHVYKLSYRMLYENVCAFVVCCLFATLSQYVLFHNLCVCMCVCDLWQHGVCVTQYWLGSRGSCRGECHSALTFLCKLITKAAKAWVSWQALSFLSVYSSTLHFSLFLFISLILFSLHALHSPGLCVHTILLCLFPTPPHLLFPYSLHLCPVYKLLYDCRYWLTCFCPSSPGGCLILTAS